MTIVIAVWTLITVTHVWELTFLVVHALVQEQSNRTIHTLLAVLWTVKHKTLSANVKKAMLDRAAMFVQIIISEIQTSPGVNADLANVVTISTYLDLATVTGGQANVFSVCLILKVSAAKSVKRVSSAMLFPNNVLLAFVICWAAMLLWKARQCVIVRVASVPACPTLRACLAIAALSITGKLHRARAVKLATAIPSDPTRLSVTNSTANVSVVTVSVDVVATNVVPTTGAIPPTILAGRVTVIHVALLPNNAITLQALASVCPAWEEKNAIDALVDMSEQSSQIANLVANVSTTGTAFLR